MNNEIILKIKDVCAGYGKREVISGIDLEIKKGSFTLLIGPNGSGKSTLIKVIAGVLTPFKGKVFLNGEDITRLSPIKRINKGIGYLSQGRNIFPILTVRENLEIAGYGIKKKEIKSRIEWILNFFPFLEKKLDLRAGLLSGGERQALALGMVLMKDKEILLLDEPTAGLAPLTAQSILESIARIKKETGLTLLTVEHNLKMVKELADEIVIMRNGRILMRGNKNILQDASRIRELFIG